MKLRFLAVAALVFALFAVWSQVGSFEFISLDDALYVGNPEVQKGISIKGIEFAFQNPGPAVPHPLTLVSHMLDFQLFGGDPGSHHMVNVLFHVANTLLLLYFLTHATGAFWKSFIVVCLFALHPLRAESVAWVAERKDVLSSFFALAALCAYSHYAKSRRLGWYVGTFFLFVLGVLSKPMVVTLPALMWLLDVWPLGRVQPKAGVVDAGGRWSAGFIRWLSLGIEKIPFFAVAFSYSVLCVAAIGQSDTLVEERALPLQIRLLGLFPNYAAYLGKILWPEGVCVIYPHPLGWSVFEMTVSLLVLAAASGLVVWLAVKKRMLAPLIGWLWFLGLIFPVSGILQNGSQSIADRYTYLPSVGIAVSLVWLLEGLVENRPRSRAIAGILAAVATALLGIETYRTVRDWRDSEAVYTKALRVNDKVFMPHFNLSILYSQQGRHEEALVHAEKALEILPRKESLGRKASVLVDLGLKSDGSALYEQALQKEPFYLNANLQLGGLKLENAQSKEALSLFFRALQADANHAKTISQLVNALVAVGRLDYAEKYARRALQLAPGEQMVILNLWSVLKTRKGVDEGFGEFHAALAADSATAASAHVLCGFADKEQGDLASARRHFEAALALQPVHSGAELGLAECYIASGEVDKAMLLLEAAISSDPQSARILLKFSLLLSTHESQGVSTGQEAEALAERASRLLGGTSAYGLLVMANAKAAKGEFDVATKMCVEAAMLASRDGNQALEDKIRRAQLAFAQRQRLDLRFF